MKTQSADTSPEMEALQIALLRCAPIWRRLELLDGLNRSINTIAWAGLCRRHPHESRAEIRRRLAAMRLGPELPARFYESMLMLQESEGKQPVQMTAIAVTLLVIDELEALDIPYALGGSMASSAYGIYRSTNDADILADIAEAQADALARALEGRFYVDAESIREAIRYRSSFNVIHLDTMFKVDLFIPRGRAFDRNQLARRVSQVVAVEPERHAFLASPEDTVLAKLEWYRAGGEISDRQWNDIGSVLKVQAESVDRAYLRQWARTLGLSDLLDRALVDAGLEDTGE